MDSPSYKIIHGDANSVIPTISERFRAIITSPPYYRHRHYGSDPSEIGQEKSVEQYLEVLTNVFRKCKRLLTDDGSLWVVIGDTRWRHEKLRIPHRLADRLVDTGYIFREDIIWFKKNSVSSSSPSNFSQAYEYVLYFSKERNSYTDLDSIRILGNEAAERRNRVPSSDMMQYNPSNIDKNKIQQFVSIIHNSSSLTPDEYLPTTAEIARAYGYDPEKFCPTCYRKFKRHATRRRVGGHKHYPIFAVCNPRGKNPTNVWQIATKAHYGNEHFAIFPESLVERIVKFSTQRGDAVFDPFAGRGTTGIVALSLGRRFVGVELYKENIRLVKQNMGKEKINLIQGLSPDILYNER